MQYRFPLPVSTGFHENARQLARARQALKQSSRSSYPRSIDVRESRWQCCEAVEIWAYPRVLPATGELAAAVVAGGQAPNSRAVSNKTTGNTSGIMSLMHVSVNKTIPHASMAISTSMEPALPSKSYVRTPPTAATPTV